MKSLIDFVFFTPNFRSCLAASPEQTSSRWQKIRSQQRWRNSSCHFLLQKRALLYKWSASLGDFSARTSYTVAACISKVKLSSSEKNAILNAVSWYDAAAEKVIKGTVKLTGDKLEQLLAHLNCTETELANHGYFATDKKGEYLEYETESDLRDTENVPIKENIYAYFLREVKPHVAEAWINLNATKIGYEISFNKYFYRHKPLRDMEEVSSDILKLEALSDGLIREILNLDM